LPKNAPPSGDPHLSMRVLQMQNDYYGPISREKFKGLIDDTVQPLLQQFKENYRQFPLSAASRRISQEDVDFFSYIMNIDPRQRPTAREALKHSWFDSV
jgi:serine/threonine protein kinase